MSSLRPALLPSRRKTPAHQKVSLANTMLEIHEEKLMRLNPSCPMVGSFLLFEVLANAQALVINVMRETVQTQYQCKIIPYEGYSHLLMTCTASQERSSAW